MPGVEVLHSFTVLAGRQGGKKIGILGSKSEDVETRGHSSFSRRSCKDKVYIGIQCIQYTLNA